MRVRRRGKWLRRVLVGIVALFVALIAFSYFALPSILRTQAERIASQTLHRSLTIERIEVHPLDLAVSIQGLRLHEPDGKAVFASFERLDVRLSASSLAHLAPVVSEVHLVGPNVHLTRTGANSYSTDDIVAALAAASPAPTPAPAPAAPPRFAVYNIRIEGGHFEFDDLPKQGHHAITDFSLGIPFVSTFVSEENVFVEPALQAVIDGAPLAIHGRALPFASTRDFEVKLDFADIDLPRYMEYVPGPPPVRLPSGRLDLHLQAKAQLAKDQPPALSLTGTVAVKSLELTSAARKPMLKLASLALQVRRAEWPAGAVDVELVVNDQGRLDVSGTVGTAPTHVDVDIALQNLDLLPAQPLFADRVNLRVTHAGLSTKGHLRLDQADGGNLTGSFAGDLSLDKLATIDAINSNEFLSWDALAVRGVRLQLAPFALHIDQVKLQNYYARVIIDPSGRINLQDIVRAGTQEEKRSLTEAAPAAPAPSAAGEAAVANAAAPSASPGAAPPPISIGAIDLQGGHVRFSDNFIQPKYTADLVELAGKISRLSSDAATTAEVDLHGQVNGAPLLIGGTVNPLSRDLSLDIKASVHDMELAPLTTYSAKYVGYRIDRGKLSFDVAYQLANRQLHAENRLVLDQLTFGDKVESASATSLPVQLAVALLKDRNGVIDINLPIGGSLDDPEFSVGSIIVRVLVNLITKAVTAPFALLGSLFGGGEELSWLDFPPGQATIAPAGEERLRSLAKALSERPGLKLEITGWADPQSDDEGLRASALQSKLRALQRKERAAHAASESGAAGGATGDRAADNAIAPQAYPGLVARLYAQEMAAAAAAGKPAGDASGLAAAAAPVASAKPAAPGAQPPAAPPTTEQMEQALRARQQISEEDLRNLGNQRAQAAKAWLKTIGMVSEDRLSLIGSKITPQADAAAAETAGKPGGESTDGAKKAAPGSRVQFSLR